jgi:hypothetical protein
MEIIVFKTNIRRKKQVELLNQYMQNISGIVQWNVDLWDKDKILRVVSNSASPRSVEQHLRRAGYYCEELRD